MKMLKAMQLPDCWILRIPGRSKVHGKKQQKREEAGKALSAYR